MQLAVFLLYLVSVAWGTHTIWKAFQAKRFSFHLFFSLVYFVTFYFGFPFSWLMALGFEHTLPNVSVQLNVFLMALIGYWCYQIGYGLVGQGKQKDTVVQPPILANFSAKLTACLLAILALGSLFAFIGLNEGFLLYKLEKYSQIFSAQVQGVPLKRFFYFFLPAMLIFFLLKPSRKRWWLFLCYSVVFGILSYIAVGGTRANLALAVLFFILLGLYRGYLSIKWLGLLACGGIVAMFGLALARYHLDIRGGEIWHTFLYLTRDTFSPWENVARIFDSRIEFQGLMPIVRDFYVYIPQSLWQERPDIVWNTANYFTKTVLENYSGLAISPTIIGSFYIMGGNLAITLGMLCVGVVMRMLDLLLDYSERHSIVLQAYLWGQLFNLMVLVREGFDAFVSRFVFFSIIFGACWLCAKLLEKVCKK